MLSQVPCRYHDLGVPVLCGDQMDKDSKVQLDFDDQPVDDLLAERATEVLLGFQVHPVSEFQQKRLTRSALTLPEIQARFGDQPSGTSSNGPDGPVSWRWSNGQLTAIDFGHCRVIYRDWEEGQ